MKTNINLLNPLKQNINTDYSERRSEPRLPAHLPSVLMDKGKTIYTTIINLSSQGVGFLSAVPLDSNDEVKITFERRSANTMVPVELKINVRSCHEVDFEYYIGGCIEEKSVEYTKFFSMLDNKD